MKIKTSTKTSSETLAGPAAPFVQINEDRAMFSIRRLGADEMMHVELPLADIRRALFQLPADKLIARTGSPDRAADWLKLTMAVLQDDPNAA